MDLVDTGSFKRRSFVVDFQENPLYPQYVTFELVQDRVELIDKFKVGDKIEVTFNLKGREWKSPEGVVKYFNTLEAWRIASAGESAREPSNVVVPDVVGDAGDSELPF